MRTGASLPCLHALAKPPRSPLRMRTPTLQGGTWGRVGRHRMGVTKSHHRAFRLQRSSSVSLHTCQEEQLNLQKNFTGICLNQSTKDTPGSKISRD